MKKVFVVMIGSTPDNEIVFSKEENAVEYIKNKWHEVMRFFQFSKYEAKSASDNFIKKSCKEYSIRDLDGHIHSAKIVEKVIE